MHWLYVIDDIRMLSFHQLLEGISKVKFSTPLSLKYLRLLGPRLLRWLSRQRMWASPKLWLAHWDWGSRTFFGKQLNAWCWGRSRVLKTTRSWPAHQKCTEVQFLWKRLNGKKQPPKVWFFHGFSRCVFMVILYPLWAPMPCWWVWPAQVGFCRPFDPRSIFVVCELMSLRRLTRPMVVLRLVCGAETWKSHFRSTQYIQVRESQGTIGNKYTNISI